MNVKEDCFGMLSFRSVHDLGRKFSVEFTFMKFFLLKLPSIDLRQV